MKQNDFELYVPVVVQAKYNIPIDNYYRHVWEKKRIKHHVFLL